MLAELKKVNRILEEATAGADPDLVETSQAAAVYVQACEIVRRGEAIKILYASRTTESQVWKDEGHRSPEEWMASTAGAGIGEVRSTLETANRLSWLPATEEVLRRGELSSGQVKEIAAAATHRPRSEAELLQTAATGSFKGLKERCRNVLAETSSAEEDAERHRRVHEKRSFRHWSEPDGAFKGEVTLTPDDGARLLSAIQHRADELFDEARKAGREEPPAAYRADALVDLVTGSGGRRRTGRERVDMLVHVDATALFRGYVADGEMCEIRGVGPVPVATALSLLPDSWLKVVVKDGVDIRTVCHPGRTINAVLRTALEVRDPTCRVPGCDTALGLEIDHVVEVTQGGMTEIANLCRLCHYHHYLKTTHQYALSGGPGNWVWEPVGNASPAERNGQELLGGNLEIQDAGGPRPTPHATNGRGAPRDPKDSRDKGLLRRRQRKPRSGGAVAGSSTLIDSS